MTRVASPLAQVPRLQSTVRDRRANWEQSLATLRAAKTFGARVTKTSVMLGCGESPDEVLEALRLLRENGALTPLCTNMLHKDVQRIRTRHRLLPSSASR